MQKHFLNIRTFFSHSRSEQLKNKFPTFNNVIHNYLMQGLQKIWQIWNVLVCPHKNHSWILKFLYQQTVSMKKFPIMLEIFFLVFHETIKLPWHCCWDLSYWFEFLKIIFQEASPFSSYARAPVRGRSPEICKKKRKKKFTYICTDFFWLKL